LVVTQLITQERLVGKAVTKVISPAGSSTIIATDDPAPRGRMILNRVVKAM
jgi:hypothetical protein